MKTRISTACSVLLVWLVCASLWAEDWSQFRGAYGQGVVAESKLPVRWSSDRGIRWSTELSGRANSSPAVTAQRVDLTTQRDNGGLWVLSFERASGKLIREVRVGTGKLSAKGPANLYAHRHNPATPSPIADDDNIWAFFGTGLLTCVDASNGKIRWSKDLVKEYGEYDITFGMGASPRLHGDHLYLACLTKGPSYVVAIDKATGREIWKTDRRYPSKDDGPDAYSTPTIYQSNKGLSLLISGCDHVDAYDLVSGKRQWFAPGLAIDSPYGRVIASAVGTRDGVVVATSANPAGGGKGRVIGVRFDDTKRQIWSIDSSTPDSASPVIVDGLLYLVADNGVATCADVRTGKVHWKKRISTGRGAYHASVVAGGDKVYFVNIDGQCTVVEHGVAGKVLATNQLPGTFYATPAIAGGELYLRAYERLYVVDGQ